MSDKHYAVAGEVAERYRTSRAQIYDWVRQRKFPTGCVLRIGKKLLFDLGALDEWANRGGSPMLEENSQLDPLEDGHGE